MCVVPRPLFRVAEKLKANFATTIRIAGISEPVPVQLTDAGLRRSVLLHGGWENKFRYETLRESNARWMLQSKGTQAVVFISPSSLRRDVYGK